MKIPQPIYIRGTAGIFDTTVHVVGRVDESGGILGRTSGGECRSRGWEGEEETLDNRFPM